MGCLLIDTFSEWIKIHVGLLGQFLLPILSVFPSHFAYNYEVKGWPWNIRGFVQRLVAAVADGDSTVTVLERS